VILQKLNIEENRKLSSKCHLASQTPQTKNS
jgi:hypothetical protein